MDPRALESLPQLLDSLKDAVWCLDITTQKFIFINNKFTSLFEKSLADIEANPFLWRLAIHPDDYERVNRETEKLYQGHSVELEFRVIVNGKIKWISDRKAPVFNSNNLIVAITGVTSDITEKKMAELALKESELTYKYLFYNNPNPLWIYDIETLKFIASNHSAQVQYGYSEEEFLSMKATDLLSKNGFSPDGDYIASESIGYSRSELWKHQTKEGRMIDVIISEHPITYISRESKIMMAHDVTDVIKSREDAVIAKTNLDSLINNVKDLIWSIDTNFKILSINTAFNRLIKDQFGKTLKRGDLMIFPWLEHESFEAWKTNYLMALNGETAIFNSRILHLKNIHEFILSPIYRNDKIIGVSVQGRDIQDILDEAKRMRDQNRELKEIVTLVSHDVRGPVASLMGIVPFFNDENTSDPFNKEVIKHVKTLTFELDRVLHKIVDKSFLLQQE